MIRPIAILVGLGFAVVALFSFFTGLYTVLTEGLGEPTAEHEFHEYPKQVQFSFEGPLGTFDRQQLQRGYQVYKEVCASCHSLKFVAIRDLAGLGYSEAQIKAEAASFQVPGVNPDTGENALRAATPVDYFPSPYANNVMAAAANNNAIPPDLSLMAKARHDGPAYIYSLLTGYSAVPAKLKAEFPEFSKPEALHFNRYFPNLNLAMAPPLADGQITYGPGNPAPTKEQMAQDVAAFLAWTAEPTMEKRKQTGWPVVLFLIFATVLAWFAKKQLWSAVKPKKAADGDA